MFLQGSTSNHKFLHVMHLEEECVSSKLDPFHTIATSVQINYTESLPTRITKISMMISTSNLKKSSRNSCYKMPNHCKCWMNIFIETLVRQGYPMRANNTQNQTSVGASVGNL